MTEPNAPPDHQNGCVFPEAVGWLVSLTLAKNVITRKFGENMKENIAQQIADLLNNENQLVIPYTAQKIISQKGNYLFEANAQNEVLVCIECKKIQWYQFEVCHLTVNPKSRRRGYGHSILGKAIDHAILNNGRIIQCTIRKNNSASASLFLKNGFEKTSTFYYPNSGNNIEIYQKVISIAK